VNKIRKGDKVILNTGKDKGKQGIVLNILKNNRVVVEGLNMVKKHTKPNPAKGDQGGLVSKEMPINISNIAIFNTKSKQDR
jgi:large subunit ribosomal protein L24